MMRIPNKFVLLALVAIAALFAGGAVTTLSLQQAFAVKQQCAIAVVCANVNVCAQAITAGSQQKC
jgi:hypothetical protein